MHFTYLVPALVLMGANTIQASVVAERSVMDGPCKGAGGAPGVCIPTAKCSGSGGKFISNACPNLPEDIKCCTSTSCGAGGNCRFTSDCNTGNVASGLCPGPDQFKCCLPSGSGSGSGSGPPVPSVGECKAVAVQGAKAVIAAFPGKVRSIGCIRGCKCDSNSSDHCCGKAIDYMTSAGNVRTEEGRPIAEWMMNRHGELKLKYVIWGQRIWNPSRDSITPWTNWRRMGDRGSNTANHWDHVHGSFL